MIILPSDFISKKFHWNLQTFPLLKTSNWASAQNKCWKITHVSLQNPIFQQSNHQSGVVIGCKTNEGCSSGRAGNNRVMCGGEPRGAERPPRIEQVQSHWGPRYEALHLADMGSLAQVSRGQCQLTLWRHRPTLTALQSYVALHCSTADFDTIRFSRVLG